jgi:hypothetical protein
MNYRQKTNKRSLEDRQQDTFMAIKQTQGSLNSNEIIEDSPGYGLGHQHKKPRLGLSRTDQAKIAPRPGPPSQQPDNHYCFIHESPYSIPAKPSQPYRHKVLGPPNHILESEPVNKPPLIYNYESVTPSSWTAKPSLSGSSQSQYSDDTKPSPATLQTPQNDKDWAARRVPEVQAQISIINHENDAYIIRIRKLEQQVNEVKNEVNAIQLRKEVEIRKIEERCERDHEILRGRQHELERKREEDLELLGRNKRLIAKCQNKIQSFLALVDLDNE